MKELSVKLDRSSFTLLWKSLHDRENSLLAIVEREDEDSDEGADALNDLAALRLYKKELKQAAEQVFDANAFIVTDDTFSL